MYVWCMDEQLRITVSLSPKSQMALDFLAAEGSRSTKTTLVNKALQFYAEIKQLTNAGGSLYVREPGGDEVERVRFS